MPRIKRSDHAGSIYHAINRGNARAKTFHKPADHEAFLRLLGEGLEKYPAEILSFCLMRNHWHLVLRPCKNEQMGRFLGWVTATHTLRYRAHNHRKFPSHLYLGPFKSFPIADDEHFHVACRYVERNALRSNPCDSAEDWQWGSLHRWHHQCDVEPKLLSSWPTSRRNGWTERVNAAISQKELDALRMCVNRGRPFGSEEWIEETADKDGLWSTPRPRGRPRSKPKPLTVPRTG